MPRVIFTANLRRHTGGITKTEASGERGRAFKRVDADLPLVTSVVFEES